MGVKPWFYDCLNVLFPTGCPVCGKLLKYHRQCLCLECESEMPLTGYSSDPGNPIARIFWADPRIVSATSLFYFEKNSPYQALFHNLKYRNDRKMGIFLGRRLGEELYGTVFAAADVIVPVPLHPSRLKKRGYNQCSFIAAGISANLNIPVDEKLMIRTRRTASQTTKNRMERWENMADSFMLDPSQVKSYGGKSLLLIDDIITTGATLEAAANAIMAMPEVTIYIATVACA